MAASFLHQSIPHAPGEAVGALVEPQRSTLPDQQQFSLPWRNMIAERDAGGGIIGEAQGERRVAGDVAKALRATQWRSRRDAYTLCGRPSKSMNVRKASHANTESERIASSEPPAVRARA